jgi:hypothetical protein
MADKWTTHHSGTVAGRPVEVETYSEGGYRVRTDQGADDPGYSSRDESGGVIMPPSSKGDPIDIDGTTVDEVRDQLADEGFTAEQIEEIVRHFPSE